MCFLYTLFSPHIIVEKFQKQYSDLEKVMNCPQAENSEIKRYSMMKSSNLDYPSYIHSPPLQFSILIPIFSIFTPTLILQPHHHLDKFSKYIIQTFCGKRLGQKILFATEFYVKIEDKTKLGLQSSNSSFK